MIRLCCDGGAAKGPLGRAVLDDDVLDDEDGCPSEGGPEGMRMDDDASMDGDSEAAASTVRDPGTRYEE